MGQGQSVEEWREIFTTLDVDKTGRLNLMELLCSNHPVLAESSVGFLFRFDLSQEGTINFEEFRELLKYLRRLESKTQKKKTNFNLRRFLKKENSSPKRDEQEIWTTLDSKETKDIIINREAATPAFIGGTRSRKSSEELERERKELNIDQNSPIAREERKTREYLEQSLRKAEGKQRFMDWLFKLADVDKSEKVSASELELLLRALAKDQINTAQLSYDEEQITPLLLQSIMCEYDIGKTGYLTKDEFMVLADLIVRNYDVLCEEQANSQVVQDYIIRWKLGEGASGVVKLGVHKQTKMHYAIKIIRKRDCSDISMLDKEIQAMLMLRHPNVVNLEEVLEGDENVYFVMELCGGGSIADYAAIHPLSEDLARYYFYQLVQVVQYCHSQGVVHRDLKLENLLLDNEGVVHVSDFGHAGIFCQGWDLFSTAVGSLYHLSPEQINGECYSGEKTDTWAMGVALYRMVVGAPPFCSSDINEILDSIKNVKYTVPEFVSDQAKDLLDKILQYDPNNRISLSDMLKHPWLVSQKKANPSIITYNLQVTRKKFSVPDLVTCIRALDVVVVNATSSVCDGTKNYCFLKCHYPPKELKFSIALRETKNTDRKGAQGRSSLNRKRKEGEVSPSSSLVNSAPLDDFVSAGLLRKSLSEDMDGSSESSGVLEGFKSFVQSSAPQLKSEPKKSGKERKAKRKKKYITMDIQLRQGNLSELYKLAAKIILEEVFSGFVTVAPHVPKIS